MAFDFAKTLALLKGGLLDHQATWNAYLEGNPSWQNTATVLTGPIIFSHVVLSVLFSRMTGGFAYLGFHSSIFAALFWGLLTACMGFIITVLVFNYLATVFKGSGNFSRAFAAISLAGIPSWVAGILAAVIPGLGILIMLAGAITSLVFMYKIMPMALSIPDDKRLVHFIVSLLAIVILNMIVGSVMRVGSGGSGNQHGTYTSNMTTSTGSGVLGDYERQGQLMESAENDRFEPPDDGELTKSQVKAYIRVLEKTRVVQAEQTQKMQAFAKEMDAKKEAGEEPSAADMTRMFGSIRHAVSANNAEMEVVKTGDGNWAEHLWVKDQLHIAKIQLGEGSDAIAHNYKLYLKYKKELD